MLYESTNKLINQSTKFTMGDLEEALYQNNHKEVDRSMEAEALKYFIACVTAAGFGIAIAAFGCGIAQGIGLKSAVEGIARNPESSGKVTVTMLIGLAMIESLCIYALVVSLILIYAAPMTKTVTAIFAQ